MTTDFPRDIINMHAESPDICVQLHKDCLGGQREILWQKQIFIKHNEARAELLMESCIAAC